MGATAAMIAAQAAITAQATKASGAIVDIEPSEFARILGQVREPLVIVAQGGVFTKHYRYLISYKGFVFHTKTEELLVLPAGCDIVQAKDVWIPD